MDELEKPVLAPPDPTGSPDGDAVDSTQEKLLEAGYEMLLAGRPLVAIKLKQLTDKADVSTGAFYHAWPSMLDYYRDLARHASKPENSQYIFDMKDTLEALDPREFSVDEVCRIYGAMDSEEMNTDKAFHASISLWGLRNHPKVTGVSEALGDSYREFSKSYSEMYGALLDKYGFRLRPPYTLQLFAATLTALTEGMSLRRAVDPDALSVGDELALNGWEAFGLAIYTLLAAAVVPADSPDPRNVVDFTNDVLKVGAVSETPREDALSDHQNRVELAELWNVLNGEMRRFGELVERVGEPRGEEVL